MKRRTRIPLAVGLAVLTATVFLVGSCEGLRGTRFGIRSFFRSGTDYDELEAHRAGMASEETVVERGPFAPPYWTDFRGPGRLGIYDERELNLDWPEGGPPLLWRQPSGAGYGSFTVAEGLAFTLEQRREREAVVAYDVLTGREIWIHDYEAHHKDAFSGAGPRTTPVYADGAVYSLGATGVLVRLAAATGELTWRRDVLADSSTEPLMYGCAASPLVRGNRLIVFGADADQGGNGVLGYDLASGEPVWQAVSERMAYTSPVVHAIAGREQLISFTKSRMVGLDPDTGAELWEQPWEVDGGLACAQPVRIDDTHLLVSSGYGKGAALFRIQAEGDGFVAEGLWRNARLKNRYNSSVLFEGHVYGLDEGRLACIEPYSGKRIWKGGDFGYGQTLLTQGHLIILSERGEVALVAATTEGYAEKARFDAIDGMTLNLPAIADGLLFVRNHDEMACFDLRIETDR